jgi:hypothetical protein
MQGLDDSDANLQQQINDCNKGLNDNKKTKTEVSTINTNLQNVDSTLRNRISDIDKS